MKGRKIRWVIGVIVVIIAALFSFLGCDNGTTNTHTHSWSDWTTITDPTCVADGVKSRFCREGACTESESIVLPKTGHGAATCAHEYCGTHHEWDCKQGGHEILNHDHILGDWEVFLAASCEQSGRKVKTCQDSKCFFEVEEDIQPLQHAWNAWAITTQPKCTTIGEETRTCTNGNHPQKRDKDALGHAYEWTQTLAPTCTSTGTEQQVCSHDVTHKGTTRAKDKLAHKTTTDCKHIQCTDPTGSKDGAHPDEWYSPGESCGKFHDNACWAFIGPNGPHQPNSGCFGGMLNDMVDYACTPTNNNCNSHGCWNDSNGAHMDSVVLEYYKALWNSWKSRPDRVEHKNLQSPYMDFDAEYIKFYTEAQANHYTFVTPNTWPCFRPADYTAAKTAAANEIARINREEHTK